MAQAEACDTTQQPSPPHPPASATQREPRTAQRAPWTAHQKRCPKPLAVRIMVATGNPVRPRGEEEALDVSTHAQSAQSPQRRLQAKENPGMGWGESWCQSGGYSAECHCLLVCPGWQLELLMPQERDPETTPTVAQDGSAHFSSVTGTPLSTRRLKIVTSCGSSTDKRVADMKRVRK